MGRPQADPDLANWVVPPTHRQSAHRFPLVVGAGTGILLATLIATSDGLARGLGLGALIPTVILIVFVLLLAGAITRRSDPVVAAIALAGTFFVGLGVALATEEVPKGDSAPGLGTVRSGSATIWSGPVTCTYWDYKGLIVGGFHVPIEDPAFTAKRLSDGSAEIDIQVEDAKLTYVDAVLHGDVYLPVALLGVTQDLRGTAKPITEPSGSSPYRNEMEAILSDAGITLEWQCERGPG